MTLRSNAKFKEKLTCGFKFEMWVHIFITRRISWIFTQPLKILKISHWWAVFVQSIWGLNLKKYRGVIFHDTVQWYKIWINLGLVVSKMALRIGRTFIRALKRLKNCTLMGTFCQKHIMFQSENLRGIRCHDTQE